jgi:hypothetical protein
MPDAGSLRLSDGGSAEVSMKVMIPLMITMLANAAMK